jgi:hypothetical protein
MLLWPCFWCGVSPAVQRNRVPSFCDRILHRSLPGCDLAQLFFRDTPGILTRCESVLAVPPCSDGPDQ